MVVSENEWSPRCNALRNLDEFQPGLATQAGAINGASRGGSEAGQ